MDWFRITFLFYVYNATNTAAAGGDQQAGEGELVLRVEEEKDELLKREIQKDGGQAELVWTPRTSWLRKKSS